MKVRVLIFLITFLTTMSYATSTNDFIYKSKQIYFVYTYNSGDYVNDTIIRNMNEIFPYIIGIENQLAPGDNVELIFGCDHYRKIQLIKNGESLLNRDCDFNNRMYVLEQVIELLGVEKKKVDTLNGFTIQLAFVYDNREIKAEKQRWENYLCDFYVNEDYEISILGDYCNTVWIKTYKNGFGICTGVFQEYSSCLNLIKDLKLPKKNYQIVPELFILNKIEKYMR